MASFATVDAEAARRAGAIEVRSGLAACSSRRRCCSTPSGAELARVEAAIGSPERPLDEHALARKVERAGVEAGSSGALDDPARPARELLELAGLAPGRVGG